MFQQLLQSVQAFGLGVRLFSNFVKQIVSVQWSLEDQACWDGQDLFNVVRHVVSRRCSQTQNRHFGAQVPYHPKKLKQKQNCFGFFFS